METVRLGGTSRVEAAAETAVAKVRLETRAMEEQQLPRDP